MVSKCEQPTELLNQHIIADGDHTVVLGGRKKENTEERLPTPAAPSVLADRESREERESTLQWQARSAVDPGSAAPAR